MWLHSEKSTWLDKNIKLKEPCREVVTTQMSHFVSLTKFFGLYLRTKWFFRYCTCFEQWFPWNSGQHIFWIASEKRTWHDKNIKSNATYRYILTSQLSHLVKLANWLSVRLRTKWLSLSVPLQPLKLEMLRLFRAMSFFVFFSYFILIWFVHSFVKKLFYNLIYTK